MKIFITTLMLFLAVLGTVQAECNELEIKKDLQEKCEKGTLPTQRKFAHPAYIGNYLECENKELKENSCTLYFNPFDNSCTNNFEDSVLINEICSEEDKEPCAYLDSDILDDIEAGERSRPSSEYFVKCDDPQNPKLYMCYGETVKCGFNADTKKCEEKP